MVLSRGAATRDRYGSVTPSALAPGIDADAPSPVALENVYSLPLTANGTIITGGMRFAAFGPRGHAVPTLPIAARPIARFEDGTVAAASTAVGAGSILRLLWFPGLSWEHSGFLAGSTDFLVGDVLRAAGVTPG